MYKIDRIEIKGILSSFRFFVYYKDGGDTFDIVYKVRDIIANMYESCSINKFKDFLYKGVSKQYETIGGFVFSGDPCYGRLYPRTSEEIDSKDYEDEITSFDWEYETITTYRDS